jgi:hypothetical protein
MATAPSRTSRHGATAGRGRTALLAVAAALGAALAAVLLGSGDDPTPPVAAEPEAVGAPDAAAHAPQAERTTAGAVPATGGVLPERELANDPTFSRPVPAARPREMEGKAGKRSGSSVLFESEQGEAYDTTTAVEVPLEDGFPPRGTVSFWLNSSWGATNQDDASFVSVADGRLRLVKNVSFLRFEAVDDKGFGDGVGVPITGWGPDDWHFVTATWDEGVITLYVDGVLVGQKFIPWLDLPEDSRLVLGSQYPPGRPVAIGTMATFTLQGRPLTADAVGRKFQRTPPPLPEDDAAVP